MSRNLTGTLIVVFGLTLLSLPSFCQTFGEISGLVTDSSGSVIAGANLTHSRHRSVRNHFQYSRVGIDMRELQFSLKLIF
jgi:hypothetical protein